MPASWRTCCRRATPRHHPGRGRSGPHDPRCPGVDPRSAFTGADHRTDSRSCPGRRTLGTWRGAASQLLYLLLGLFLPVDAGGTSGLSILTGANGGYIVGFVLAAALTGWAAEHRADRRLLLAPLTFALGQLAIFGIGVPWLKLATGLSWNGSIHAGFTPFILGGVIKAAVAAAALPAAWQIQRRVSRH